MTEKLAALGGPAAVTGEIDVRWPRLNDADQKAVVEVLDRARERGDPLWGAAPETISRFERRFAAYIGAGHALYTNSGTAALHMAVAALGIGPGDEVIVPAFSFISTATCVLQHNAVPVFADVDPASGLIDPACVERAISPRTRAILPVHIHGLPADMESILRIAKAGDVAVIEDACQAVGGSRKGKKLGTFGLAGAFSLNGGKLLTSAEGGFLVTDDGPTSERAALVRSFGEEYGTGVRRYSFNSMGWMYRSTELTAALGMSQLDRLDEYSALRKKNSLALLRGLESLRSPSFSVYMPEDRGEHQFQLFTVTLNRERLPSNPPLSVIRDRVRTALAAEGVPADLWQRKTLPEQKLFQDREGYGSGCPWTCRFREGETDYDPAHFPGARQFVDSYFSIGSMVYPVLAMEDAGVVIDQYVEAFRKVFCSLDAVIGKVRSPDETSGLRRAARRIIRGR